MITLRHSINAAAEMYYLSGERKDPNRRGTRQGWGLFGTDRKS